MADHILTRSRVSSTYFTRFTFHITARSCCTTATVESECCRANNNDNPKYRPGDLSSLTGTFLQWRLVCFPKPPLLACLKLLEQLALPPPSQVTFTSAVSSPPPPRAASTMTPRMLLYLPKLHRHYLLTSIVPRRLHQSHACCPKPLTPAPSTLSPPPRGTTDS